MDNVFDIFGVNKKQTENLSGNCFLSSQTFPRTIQGTHSGTESHALSQEVVRNLGRESALPNTPHMTTTKIYKQNIGLITIILRKLRLIKNPTTI